MSILLDFHRSAAVTKTNPEPMPQMLSRDIPAMPEIFIPKPLIYRVLVVDGIRPFPKGFAHHCGEFGPKGDSHTPKTWKARVTIFDAGALWARRPKAHTLPVSDIPLLSIWARSRPMRPE
jgi:hypothetical protein